MQIANDNDYEEPRKSNVPDNNNFLSVAKLETLPLKKRLEILFISNIIPSRRQLAYKYGLDEQLIHNVLSHRAYILQNWKYNPNTESLLAKPELETAMAFMELLIEWKRRVELNGLQMTHAALQRKTLTLHKMLDTNTINPSESWWQLFNENWEHKQFRDSENDSLEFEDILNDLQWMFTENAFKRLTSRLRRARNAANRTRMKREMAKNMDDSENESNNDDDLFDVSDIKAEPLYYNDDEFECEDYEFVLEEEIVYESLRRELANAEEAKYKSFTSGDNDTEHTFLKQSEIDAQEHTQEFESTKAESFGEFNVKEEIESKPDIVLNEYQEQSSFLINTVNPSVSIDPLWSTMFNEPTNVPVPIKFETKIVTKIHGAVQVPTTAPVEKTKIMPKPFRRKARNLYEVPTIRKDSVRLPMPAEVANFSVNKFVAQELQISDDYEVVEKENDNLETPTQSETITTIEKHSPESSSLKGRTTGTSLSKNSCASPNADEVSINFDDVTFAAESEETESHTISSFPSSSSAEALDPSIVQIKTDLHDLTDLLKSEENSQSAPTDTCEILLLTATTKTSLSHDESCKHDAKTTMRRSKRKNNKPNGQENHIEPKTIADETELMLGICPSMDVLEETNQVEPPTPSPVSQYQRMTMDERRKQKFKDRIKVTSVQILDKTLLKDNSQSAIEEKIPKIETAKKSTPKSSTKTTNKRNKRRTDDSDLTLRRDKIRIGPTSVTVVNKIEEKIS